MVDYLPSEGLIDLIDEPARTSCRRILADNRALFEATAGSTHNHQAWPGGYIDHVAEIMNIARLLYPTLAAVRPLPFSLSDALLVTFLHDVEKPWKYERGADGQLRHSEAMRTREAMQAFRERKLAEYGIALTAEQANGLQYIEGEIGSYTNQRRVMGPLAAFCHLCDVTSARVWFDHPRAAGDPWPGAGRVRTA